jgi:hypothetical protein
MKKLLQSILNTKAIWLLLIIMVFSVVFRYGLYSRFSRSESMQSTMAWVDSWDYVNYSKAIFNGVFLSTDFDAAESEFYRIDEVPPVYPVILAVFYKAAGYDNLKSVILLNLLFNLLIMYLMYVIAKKLTGDKLALLPPLLWGLYINSLILTGQALKEPVITIFLLVIVYLLYSLFINYRHSTVVLLALSNAVFAHLDERYLFMTALSFVVVGGILIKQDKKRLLLGFTILYIVICAIVYTPWQLRNYYRYGRFVLITPRTTLITDPLLGYEQSENVLVDLTTRISPEQIDSIYRGTIPASVDTVAVKSILKGQSYGIRPHYYNIWEKIIYNTMGFWQAIPLKPYFIGSGFKVVTRWAWKWSIMVITGYTIFLLLSIPAFVSGIRQRKFLMILFLLIIVINTLQHAVLGAGIVRYRSVMDPLIYISAAYTMSLFAERLQRKSK